MQKAERWLGLDFEPLLDVLASYARTALDDPSSVDDEELEDPGTRVGKAETMILRRNNGYAIGKLDDLINLLNPSMETTETFARSFTVLGRHLADRVDRMENLALDDGEEVWGEAINAISGALDLIDEAISSLRPDES